MMKKIPGKIRWTTYKEECFVSQEDFLDQVKQVREVEGNSDGMNRLLDGIIQMFTDIGKDWEVRINEKRNDYFKNTNQLN